MNYVIVLIVLIISIFLFKKASGTLKINYLNVINYSFYSLLLFEFIGVSLIFLGFNNHYLVNRITNPDSIQKCFYSLSYVMIMLPLSILFFNKVVYKNDKV